MDNKTASKELGWPYSSFFLVDNPRRKSRDGKKKPPGLQCTDLRPLCNIMSQKKMEFLGK